MVKKSTQPSDLQGHLGYWLRLVSNHVSHSFARKLDSEAVTVAEWVVLREMLKTNETSSPSDIVKLTGHTKGAVSKLLERLLKKGLINRKQSRDDRRSQEVKLTHKGRLLIPSLAKLADQNDEEFFKSLTKSEQKNLRRLLQKIAEDQKLTQAPIS